MYVCMYVHLKAFVRQNKFHTYLTRETLPAEERVS